jgi:predicted  nucleic acid-binding Zn-ribbon protein
MIKLKSLNKKLRRLQASLQKDAKKLAKLQRKVEAALRAESAPARVSAPGRVEGASRSAAPPAKKKRELTPAGREKLSAMMKARWAAKRAGVASGAAGVGQSQNADA